MEVMQGKLDPTIAKTSLYALQTLLTALRLQNIEEKKREDIIKQTRKGRKQIANANAEASATRVTAVIYPEHGTGRAAKLVACDHCGAKPLIVRKCGRSRSCAVCQHCGFHPRVRLT
jgi:hypothetical protein